MDDPPGGTSDVAQTDATTPEAAVVTGKDVSKGAISGATSKGEAPEC